MPILTHMHTSRHILHTRLLFSQSVLPVLGYIHTDTSTSMCHIFSDASILTLLQRIRDIVDALYKCMILTYLLTSTEEPRSCLHHLLPSPCNSVLLSCFRASLKFPHIPNRTKKYQTFTAYAFSKYHCISPAKYLVAHVQNIILSICHCSLYFVFLFFSYLASLATSK